MRLRQFVKLSERRKGLPVVEAGLHSVASRGRQGEHERAIEAFRAADNAAHGRGPACPASAEAKAKYKSADISCGKTWESQKKALIALCRFHCVTDMEQLGCLRYLAAQLDSCDGGGCFTEEPPDEIKFLFASTMAEA